jgi:hypothetical protein
MSSPSVFTNGAIAGKCGRVSPESAMNVTCTAHARTMPRLLTMPWVYAKSTALSNIAGG